MKFGKEFQTHLEETIPEWREKFLRYKFLKRLLNLLKWLLEHIPAPAPATAALLLDADNGSIQRIRYSIALKQLFVRILNEELKKFNDFFVEKEEDFIIRFQGLKERIERVKEKSSKGGVFISESKFSEEMLDIRKDFVSIHGEMVLLKNYSSLNFVGLTKILKKYDKRTGGWLQLPFTQRALHQPFFSTEHLTRLVRECEANLELLFPLEAEVIGSTPPPERDQMDPPHDDTMNGPPETSSSVGDATVDIYRSTLAAMRTIQGLRRASSTYNPLSFASFQSQEDKNSSDVTTENSSSNSSATL